VPNLKFVALPLRVPEIIAGTQNFGQSLDTFTIPVLPNFKGFCSDGPVNIPAKFEVRSFTRSCDNRGYSKNLGNP